MFGSSRTTPPTNAFVALFNNSFLTFLSDKELDGTTRVKGEEPQHVLERSTLEWTVSGIHCIIRWVSSENMGSMSIHAGIGY